MRYLRMLTNSLVAGALGAAFVGILVLQLNPGLPLTADVVAPLYLKLLALYGTHLAVAFYTLIVVRQLFSREILSPGWLSLRLLAWLSAAIAGTASILMWVNLSDLRLVLEREATRRMAAGSAATGVCAALLLIIAIVNYSFGRRGSRTAVALFAATVACAVALPVAARGWGRPASRAGRPAMPPPMLTPAPAAARVVLVLLDGASLEYIAPATAEGRLPNLGRVLDQGASMHLTTIRPTQPATVWAAVATGKYPAANGVRSAATYGFGHRLHRLELLPDHVFSYALLRVGMLDAREHDAGALRARPLWEILSRQNIGVGVVGWPLSDPVRPVRGYIVSDRVHRVTHTLLPLEDPRLVYPADAFTSASPPGVPGTILDGPGGDADAAASAPETSTSIPAGRDLASRDEWYGRIVAALEERYQPQVAAVRFQGIDAAGHHYLRYAMPRAFGDVSEEERRRHGLVLEREYARVDERVGAYLATLGPDDVLLIVSGFGMEPVSVVKRLLARALGERDLTGTHERGPDGFLLAYGGPVASGRLALGAVVDVTPTILYFLGLPVGRDMDGYARTDLFKRSFTAERPITFIPSYE